jgi:general secretion pathway protein N
MSRRLRDAALLAVLATASAVLALQIARLGEPSLPDQVRRAEPAEVTPETFRLPQPQPVALAEVSAALERPLFTQSRRPPAAPAAPPRRLEATLAGVLTDGPEKVAIVVSTGVDRAHRLREGDVFQGWRVAKIEDDAILLERDGRSERLVLTFRGAPAPTPE